MADTTAKVNVSNAKPPENKTPLVIKSVTQPSIIIALIASITYVVGLYEAAVCSHPFKAYLGVKVGAKNNAGKNRNVAAWAP